MAPRGRRQDIRAIEHGILDLLRRRSVGKSICPSEVARMLGGRQWRGRMDAVREAAWRLEAAGQVRVLQRGRPVERTRVRGPIRIALSGAPQHISAASQRSRS